MSGILKKKKYLCMAGACLLAAAFGVICDLAHINREITITVYALGLAVVVCNAAVCRKMKAMSAPFMSFSGIRNVDYLLIGDFCNPADYILPGSSWVQIASPERGMASAYQILRHTHSILKEGNGTVIMATGKSRKEFTIFDMPFLHLITVKKYHLEGLKMKSRFPVIFAPIGSIRFLFGGGYGKYVPVQTVDAELAAFCKDRGYALICLEKQ